VILAPNGDDAFKLFIKESPDIVVTDIKMPGIDGIELIKRIKSQAKLAYIPIIMCSGVMTTSQNLKTALNVVSKI